MEREGGQGSSWGPHSQCRIGTAAEHWHIRKKIYEGKKRKILQTLTLCHSIISLTDNLKGRKKSGGGESRWGGKENERTGQKEREWVHNSEHLWLQGDQR